MCVATQHVVRALCASLMCEILNAGLLSCMCVGCGVPACPEVVAFILGTASRGVDCMQLPEMALDVPACC